MEEHASVGWAAELSIWVAPIKNAFNGIILGVLFRVTNTTTLTGLNYIAQVFLVKKLVTEVWSLRTKLNH